MTPAEPAADPRVAYEVGRPPWPQHVREVIRCEIGWALAEPFWRFHLLGERALNVSTALVRWAEKASASTPAAGGDGA